MALTTSLPPDSDFDGVGTDVVKSSHARAWKAGLVELDTRTTSMAQSYVYDAGQSTYVAATSPRTFVGSVNPETIGFTLDADDSWYDTSDPLDGPVPNGYLAWAFDAANATTNSGTGVGTVYSVRVAIERTVTASNVVLWVSTAGTGSTSAFAGIYSTGGSRLAVSADLTTTFDTAGGKTIPMTSAVTLTRGHYYVSWITATSTGTAPGFLRGSAFGLVNYGVQSGNTIRFRSVGSQTSLPTTLGLGGTNANAWWAAIS